MIASTRLVFLLILVFMAINTFAKNGFEGKKSIYLQLGASGGFSPDFSQTVFIPKLGLDATLGWIGFRADGQFFKTSPAFDINGYLDPIKSVLTISNLQETNSNILLDINPYLNFGKKAFSIQPGIGLKYLMQKGATATAIYNQIPSTSILRFPDGDANRNLFVIEPNIRATFGKPGNFLRFYIEAGYSIPQGTNEYSFSSRSIPNVVDPRGNVDIKALLNSKEVTTTGDVMPAFTSVGAGVEMKLFSGKSQDNSRTNVPNNYGINDDGIKKSISQNEINLKDSSSNLFLAGCRRYISTHTWGDGPCSAPPGNGGTVTYSYICANGSYIRSSPMICPPQSINKIINQNRDNDFTILHFEGKSQFKCNSDNPIILSIFDKYVNYIKKSIIGKNITDVQLDNFQVMLNDDTNTIVSDSINITTETQIIDNQNYYLLADLRFRLRNHAKYNAAIDDCVPWHKGWCFILDFGGNNTQKPISNQLEFDLIELDENKNTMIICYDLSIISEKPKNGTYNCTVPEIEFKDNRYMQVLKYKAEGNVSSTKNTIGKVKVINNKAYVSMRYINKK